MVLIPGLALRGQLDPSFTIDSACRNAQLEALPENTTMFTVFYDKEEVGHPLFGGACGCHSYPVRVQGTRQAYAIAPCV